MLKLIIKSKDEYSNYELIDEKNNTKYEVNINFMDVNLPELGDYIYIPKKVLQEDVSLNYGLIDTNVNAKEDELILIVHDNEKMYLQRFYG